MIEEAENGSIAHEHADVGRMDFGQALKVLKDGGRVYRKGWSSTDLYLMVADGGTVIAPCVLQRQLNGAFVPWGNGAVDVLANDWFVTVAG